MPVVPPTPVAETPEPTPAVETPETPVVPPMGEQPVTGGTPGGDTTPPAAV
jgi:hypothetical protein